MEVSTEQPRLAVTLATMVFATFPPHLAGVGLTLWPDGEPKPVVSNLSALDGAITSNMAIMPNLDSYTDAYASNTTQLALDIMSYFAP